MALPKLFQRIFWHNNTTPAVNEDNLNSMSKAINDIDDRVITLGSDVMEKIPQIQGYLDQADELVDQITELTTNPPYIGSNGNWYVWNTSTGAYVDSGIDASITLTIADITMLAPNESPRVTNTGTNTDPIFHLFIPRGKGITSVEKTSTSGLVDTYTITYSDGYTSTFSVTNGKTAYQSAVEGGYQGTEAQFETDLANFQALATAAQQAKINAETAATNANNSATSASTSATTSSNHAEDSEAWATGQRNGTDVPSTDPTYHNNAKYYKDQAAAQTLSGLSDVDINDNTLANGQVPVYNSTTEKWENGVVDVASKLDSDNVAPVETGNTASQSYAVGSHLIWNGIYYEVIQAIASGGAFNVGVNIKSNIISQEIENLYYNSTNEQEIGIWTNGKKLYRKVIRKSSLALGWNIDQTSLPSGATLQAIYGWYTITSSEMVRRCQIGVPDYNTGINTLEGIFIARGRGGSSEYIEYMYTNKSGYPNYAKISNIDMVLLYTK